MEEQFTKRTVRTAQAARNKSTPAERALWAMLRGNRCGGFYFRRQAIIASFRVDFYCTAVRLTIDVDGSVHNTPNAQRHDTERQAILEEEFGVTFLRLTNDAVLKHPDETLQTILLKLRHLSHNKL